ncbi:hypothetical protein [Photobacterium leiognathi]|uniref:hypothetical protein n=1 Tax=Photobacterium leiognathi TaxID=553611 RepID=UPI002735477D|nr:hypothetical protein [Photobacterium leiognathi]
MDLKIFSNLFYLVHESGDHLYPCRMKNKDTGKVCFRLSEGGKAGNTKEVGIEVDCELKMKDLVLNQGYAVRAKTLDKGRNGLYKLNQRSIIRAVEN